MSTPPTMQALFPAGEVDLVIQETAVPTPGPGQLLVRAHAASINNADALPRPDPAGDSPAGYEFAGEVAAVGDHVDTPLGSRVMGTSSACFAQYVLVDHRHVVDVPDSLDWAQAAALPTGLLTEHGALTLAGFTAGQTVLITGASSAIGLIGLQVARALGASSVIGSVRSRAKAHLVHDTGADVVVVTEEQDLTTAVLEATDGAGVDVVLDHVGGATFAACLPATAVDGQVVNIGRLDTAEATIDIDALSYRHLTVRGVSFGGGRPDELAAVLTAVTDHVLPAVADGSIRPPVDSTSTFADAGQALERVRSGAALGKVVLTVP